MGFDNLASDPGREDGTQADGSQEVVDRAVDIPADESRVVVDLEGAHPEDADQVDVGRVVGLLLREVAVRAVWYRRPVVAREAWFHRRGADRVDGPQAAVLVDRFRVIVLVDCLRRAFPVEEQVLCLADLGGSHRQRHHHLAASKDDPDQGSYSIVLELVSRSKVDLAIGFLPVHHPLKVCLQTVSRAVGLPQVFQSTVFQSTVFRQKDGWAIDRRRAFRLMGDLLKVGWAFDSDVLPTASVREMVDSSKAIAPSTGTGSCRPG